MKRSLAPVLGLILLCASPAVRGDDFDTITADELKKTGEIEVDDALALHRSDVFRDIDGSVLIHGLPVLTLLDGRRFLNSTALGRMGMAPLDLLPLAFLSGVEVQPVSASPRYGSDAPGGVVNLRLDRNFSGAEIGVFYGKSGGKYGREDFETYFRGGVGNEKFQINVGAAYRESEGTIPSFRGR